MKRKKISYIDWAVMVIFIAIIIGRCVVLAFFFKPMLIFFYDFIFAFLILTLMMSSYLYKYSNMSFSLMWFLLCIIYALPGNRPLAFFGLLLFIAYHIIRLSYIRRFGQEFIPPEPSKNRFIPVYNIDEQRESNEQDNLYMRIFTWCGLIILIACVFVQGHITR
ncbi:hypothetical protein SAMN03159284_03697 [Mucilaginibacter sp. NFR10]|nr:hypothetical protein SAMN03159284_03697 [Mucilaginibacter sp. NFR10]